jgi:hypothetical protein
MTMIESRALTPEQAEARAELCFNLHQEIVGQLRAGREAVWQMARALHEFDEENGWTALGHDTLNEWLAQPDIGIMRRTYYKMVAAWRELAVLRQVSEEELAELDISKVEVVLPALKSGRKQLTEALDDVKALGFRDLREVYVQRPEQTIVEGTASEPDDDDEPTDPPVNDGTDEGEWGRAMLTPVEDADDGDEPVAEPATEEQSDKAPQKPATPLLTVSLATAIRDAEEALAVPQRLAGARQQMRAATQQLVAVAKVEVAAQRATPAHEALRTLEAVSSQDCQEILNRLRLAISTGARRALMDASQELLDFLAESGHGS